MRHNLEDKKQKTIHTSSKPVVIVVISILVVALVYSSYSASNVFAAPKDPSYDTGDCNDMDVVKNKDWVACCWDKDGKRHCQACKLKADGKTWTCGKVTSIGLVNGGSGPVFPGDNGVLEQPPAPTPRTPGQSVLPGVLEQPSTDEGVAEPSAGDEETQQRVFSPTGGCQTTSTTECKPCDPGLPGAACIPDSEWSPETDTRAATLPQVKPRPSGAGQAPAAMPTPPPVADMPPVTSPLGEVTPEAEIPPAEQTTPEPLPPCPEGQILNEESGLCVPIESPEAEEPEAAQEPQAEDQEQPSEEGGSEDEDNN